MEDRIVSHLFTQRIDQNCPRRVDVDFSQQTTGFDLEMDENDILRFISLWFENGAPLDIFIIYLSVLGNQ